MDQEADSRLLKEAMCVSLSCNKHEPCLLRCNLSHMCNLEENVMYTTQANHSSEPQTCADSTGHFCFSHQHQVRAPLQLLNQW